MRRSLIQIPEMQDSQSRIGMSGIDLDWEAYYRRFCGQHGDPVPYKGRLLFVDGWTYSSTSYGGPEWPPPDEPEVLRMLCRSYWRSRLAVVKRELLEVGVLLEGLKETQSAKSVPLQASFITEEMDDLGQTRRVIRSQDIDVEPIVGRISWLEEDITDCRRRLKEIDDEYRQRT